MSTAFLTEFSDQQELVILQSPPHYFLDKYTRAAFHQNNHITRRSGSHLFTLVSQEPLGYYENCFQESSSKNIYNDHDLLSHKVLYRSF